VVSGGRALQLMRGVVRRPEASTMAFPFSTEMTVRLRPGVGPDIAASALRLLRLECEAHGAEVIDRSAESFAFSKRWVAPPEARRQLSAFDFFSSGRVDLDRTAPGAGAVVLSGSLAVWPGPALALLGVCVGLLLSWNPGTAPLAERLPAAVIIPLFFGGYPYLFTRLSIRHALGRACRAAAEEPRAV
jgi:hypothetical protein